MRDRSHEHCPQEEREEGGMGRWGGGGMGGWGGSSKLPTTHYPLTKLTNQVVGDVSFCRNDSVAIEFIEKGVDDPVE